MASGANDKCSAAEPETHLRLYYFVGSLLACKGLAACRPSTESRTGTTDLEQRSNSWECDEKLHRMQYSLTSGGKLAPGMPSEVNGCTLRTKRHEFREATRLCQCFAALSHHQERSSLTPPRLQRDYRQFLHPELMLVTLNQTSEQGNETHPLDFHGLIEITGECHQFFVILPACNLQQADE